MSRRLWIGMAGLGVLVAAGVFGPALLDYGRFARALSHAAEAYEADGGPWPQLSDACTLCHGRNGESLNQTYADLAAQPAAYISAQLHAFADGTRDSPFMAPLALSLGDADIRRLAEYFARQRATNDAAFVPDPALRASGERLAEGCTACHGAAFMGHDLNPRLAGQGYDYLVTQMDAFAAGRRKDPTGAMNAVAAALSDRDRRAVATYLASRTTTEEEDVR